MADRDAFEAEVKRVYASEVLGRSGRLAELFAFLAARPPGSEPASQAEIAQEVFGQLDAEADDATARVYVHRLRKRLDQFYAAEGDSDGRLSIPAGSYELVFEPKSKEATFSGRGLRWLRWLIPAGVAAALLLAFYLGRESQGPGPREEANAIWQPFLASDRPILIVVGDYYIFGEIDPFDPDKSRLIRDFAIDSPTDLARAQETNPSRYEKAEDVGLNYLPVSSAYALEELVPILGRHKRRVEIMPASEVTSQSLRDYNVVYVGLVSGMHLLEDVTFMGSRLHVGDTYDELVDDASGRKFSSDEAFSLASTRYYQDWGFVTRFHEPGGALVAVVAGARDTGLRGMAPVASAGTLPEDLAKVAKGDADFEAVYDVTGQQGADLGAKLALARARR